LRRKVRKIQGRIKRQQRSWSLKSLRSESLWNRSVKWEGLAHTPIRLVCRCGRRGRGSTQGAWGQGTGGDQVVEYKQCGKGIQREGRENGSNVSSGGPYDSPLSFRGAKRQEVEERIFVRKKQKKQAYGRRCNASLAVGGGFAIAGGRENR